MKYKIYILIVLSCVVLAACETDIEKMYVNQTKIIAPPVLKNEGLTDVIINETNLNTIPVVLNWTGSDFGQNVIVAYSLEMATNASFDDSFVVIVGNNTYVKALNCEDLNKWMIANFNGFDENNLPVNVNLFMRIYATVALENPIVTRQPDKVYSNAITLSVTPYSEHL